MTTPTSELARLVRERFPLARVEIDAGLHEDGKHHVDIRLGDRLIVVEWTRRHGFGVSLLIEAALDGAPDFRLTDLDRTLACVSLLLSEAQDAGFTHALGIGEVLVANDVRREARKVSKGERRAPWSESDAA